MDFNLKPVTKPTEQPFSTTQPEEVKPPVTPQANINFSSTLVFKQKEKLDNKMFFSLTEDEKQRFTQFCKKNNVPYREVVRQLVRNLLDSVQV